MPSTPPSEHLTWVCPTDAIRPSSGHFLIWKESYGELVVIISAAAQYFTHCSVAHCRTTLSPGALINLDNGWRIKFRGRRKDEQVMFIVVCQASHSSLCSHTHTRPCPLPLSPLHSVYFKTSLPLLAASSPPTHCPAFWTFWLVFECLNLSSIYCNEVVDAGEACLCPCGVCVWLIIIASLSCLYLAASRNYSCVETGGGSSSW